jgi:hypothetical protein
MVQHLDQGEYRIVQDYLPVVCYPWRLEEQMNMAVCILGPS